MMIEEMTEAERRKWKWLKPLVLTYLRRMQTALIWLVRAPFFLISIPAYILSLSASGIADFLVKWIAIKPLNKIADKLGFYYLWDKEKFENWRKGRND